jgi:competence protein ComEC
VHCDSIGCIAVTKKFSVAVIKNAAAFAEDCGVHDLLIARRRVPATCHNAQIIDGDALSRGGVQWLRWDEGAARFEIRTAIPNLTRPWRVLPP